MTHEKYDRAWALINNILDISEESDYVREQCKIAFDHAWNIQQLTIDELKGEGAFRDTTPLLDQYPYSTRRTVERYGRQDRPEPE